ncbi:MAG: BfmA/BtgA family mobilization protein [Rikenellaceae bacterium]
MVTTQENRAFVVLKVTGQTRERFKKLSKASGVTLVHYVDYVSRWVELNPLDISNLSFTKTKTFSDVKILKRIDDMIAIIRSIEHNKLDPTHLLCENTLRIVAEGKGLIEQESRVEEHLQTTQSPSNSDDSVWAISELKEIINGLLNTDKMMRSATVANSFTRVFKLSEIDEIKKKIANF